MGRYKNTEGYDDPTTGDALSNIAHAEHLLEAERLSRISKLIPIIKELADMVGFEIVGRITLLDKETGKKYK